MSEESGFRYDIFFTTATSFMAEGRRVGILSCKICGAAVLLDDEIDTPRLHAETMHSMRRPVEREV